MVFRESDLKSLQIIEIQMLNKLIEVCERLNIKYYAIAGTCLGAVRHNGFIPWDDDIDIGIPRKDYELLKAEGPKLFPDYYFLQSYDSEPETPFCFMKLRDSRTTFIEEDMKNLSINHGIWIDIFPLDYYQENPIIRIVNNGKEMLLDQIIGRKMMKKDSSGLGLKGVLKSALISIASLKYTTMQDAVRAKDRLHINNNNGKYLFNYNTIYRAKGIIQEDWYGEPIRIAFESLEICIPQEYDLILTQVYGDYMQYPPVDKRVTHHEVVAFDTEKSYEQYVHSVR